MEPSHQLFKQKLFWYIVGICATGCISLLAVRFFATVTHETSLFFKALFLAGICAGAGTLLWRVKYKDPFESLLVLVSYAATIALLIYMGPVTLDRSLSSFIFIYAAQEKRIPADIYDEAYFRSFVERRFKDGEKMNFLTCHNNGFCTPTWKAHATNLFLYPLTNLTHTNGSYAQFKHFVKTHIETKTNSVNKQHDHS